MKYATLVPGTVFSAVLILISILTLPATGEPLTPRDTAERPNILVVLVDDLGACDLGFSGSSFHQTPRLDRLAKSGTVFTSGYAACAVCSPTRAALQSGKTPGRLGLTDWIRARFQNGVQPQTIDGQWPYEPARFDKSGRCTRLACPENPIRMELEEQTIAERLQPLGYRTGYIGKWHLGQEDFFPDRQGYDVNIGGCDLGQPPSYFDPYYPGSRENQIGDPNQNPRYRITTLKAEQPGEFLSHREAREAVKFIKQSGSQPFYLQVSHYAVHTPVMCLESVRKRYAERRNEAAESNPRLLKPFDGDHDDLSDQQTENEQRLPVYAGLVESVDDAFGMILDGLADSGHSDDTIIIFTSDNGGFLGVTDNFPLRDGKGSPYEGGLRVPAFVYVPEALRNGNIAPETSTPFYTCDILPTVMNFAGQPLSADQMKDQRLDGRDFAPFLRGETSQAPESELVWHFPHYRRDLSPWSAIRSGKWKLIRFYTPEGYVNELYNLDRDPKERDNRADEKPELVDSLSDQLDRALKNSNARLPKIDPDGKP